MDSSIRPSTRRSRIFAVGLCAAVVAGCQAPRGPGVDEDLDAPMFGGSRPTTYFIAPTSDVIHARDLAAVARVLRRYKTLDAAERALVRSSVSRRLQGLIAFEVKRIEQLPRYRAARAEIRKLGDLRLAATRSAQLDGEIRAEAMRALARRLGGMVATPVRGADNRSAVVFSRIDGDRVAVRDAAYEIDRPIASLTEGSRVEDASGTAATFVSSPPVALAAPPRPDDERIPQ